MKEPAQGGFGQARHGQESNHLGGPPYTSIPLDADFGFGGGEPGLVVRPVKRVALRCDKLEVWLEADASGRTRGT